MEQRYSVKLSTLVDEFGLTKVYTPPNYDQVKVVTPDLNRPGMQLVGFFSHFDNERLQLMGTVEIMYLKTLPPVERRKIFEELMKRHIPALIICHSMDELRSLLRDRYSENLFVIGGESVYKLLVPHCDKAYVTFSYTELKADKFFPNLNRNENWFVSAIQPTQIEGRTPFRFVEYTNTKPLPL